MKTNDNKTVRGEAIKSVLTALLKINPGAISSLHITMLTEVLINCKTFTELSEIVQLTTYRQKMVFQNAVNSLINSLINVNEKLSSYDALKEELLVTQKHFKILESKMNKERSISPKLKKILAIPITKAGFSGRVQNLCSVGEIHLISDLVSVSKHDFFRIRNCGKKSMDEVEAYLYRNGLSWKMPI